MPCWTAGPHMALSGAAAVARGGRPARRTSAGIMAGARQRGRRRRDAMKKRTGTLADYLRFNAGRAGLSEHEPQVFDDLGPLCVRHIGLPPPPDTCLAVAGTGGTA